jgi:hypothetical protein
MSDMSGDETATSEEFEKIKALVAKYCTPERVYEYARCEDPDRYVWEQIEDEPEEIKAELFEELSDDLWAIGMVVERSPFLPADSPWRYDPRKKQ